MRPVAERFSYQELDRVKWRASAGIAGLAVSAAVVTVIALPPARLLHMFGKQISEPNISAALEAIELHGLMGLLIALAAGVTLYGVRLWRSARTRAAHAHVPVRRVHWPDMTQGGRQLKQPSFLPEPHMAEARSGQEADILYGAGPSPQSASGFLMRFRRSLTLGEDQAVVVTQAWPVRRLVRHPRFRLAAETAKGSAPAAIEEQDAGTRKPKGLRHTLSQDGRGARKPQSLAPEPAPDRTTPTFHSLDTVLSRVLALGQGGAPRALLIGNACTGIDATAEAVSVARALIAGGHQVVLVDLAGGPASVSDALGFPSSPGLAELFAGRARFEDVVRIDVETPLQVITAGDPALAAAPKSPARFASVFEALTQAYDGVVLHADGDTLRKLTSVLRFELSVVIAVVDTASGAGDTKPDLSAVLPLGCPVLIYDRHAKEQPSQSPAAPVNRAVASNG